MPRTKKTLLKPTFDDNNTVSKKIGIGEFVYIGVQNNLINCNNTKILHGTKIVLDVNIDGLPLFKSSKTCIWPILGAIVDSPEIYPFVIGAYCGTGHPESHELFFEDFAKECKNLTSQGILVSKQMIKKDFEVRLLCYKVS